jgi:hypothetical protein
VLLIRLIDVFPKVVASDGTTFASIIFKGMNLSRNVAVSRDRMYAIADGQVHIRLLLFIVLLFACACLYE